MSFQLKMDKTIVFKIITASKTNNSSSSSSNSNRTCSLQLTTIILKWYTRTTISSKFKTKIYSSIINLIQIMFSIIMSSNNNIINFNRWLKIFKHKTIILFKLITNKDFKMLLRPHHNYN